MGKREELRLLRNSTSADAPVNYHHRTGDSEGSGGSMLDLYAQVQSVEDDILEEEDKAAQGVFIRAFKLFLRQTLTGKERKFLNAVMSGKGKPHEIGRAMKINWFDCMQEIQRKAFANAETFKRVATLSGWSRAELFSEAVFKRLRDMGGKPIAEESREKKRISARVMLAGFGNITAEDSRTSYRYYQRMWKRAYREEKREKYNAYMREFRAKNKDKVKEYNRRSYAKMTEEQREIKNAKYRARYQEHLEEERAKGRAKWKKINSSPELREKELARARAYHAEHAEERNAKGRAYFAENREEINAKHRAYYEANKERIQAARKTPEKIAKRREYMAAYYKTEEYKAKDRARKKAKQEQKKAAKLAAQALAGLMAISQTEPAQAVAVQ